MRTLLSLVAALAVTWPVHVDAAPKLLSWEEIDRLADEQKLEAAADAASARLESARGGVDEAEWARALIKVVQLRIGLHGYETAVRFLRTEPWPKGLTERAALELYYANALVSYARAYGWEIRQRERVESSAPVDLKAWTMEQIHAEAQRAFESLWKRRQELGAIPLSRLSEHIQPNNYPKGVRDTLRDAVTYLRADFLSDTTGWRAEHQNELFRLDVAALAKGQPAHSASVKLDDPEVHPLVKIGAILDDLEQWHAGAKRLEAELEARRYRLELLHRPFSDKDDRAVIRKELEAALPAFRGVPHYATGLATLAELTMAADELPKALKIAQQGRDAYPQSVGGQRCASLVAQIEAPDVHLQSMFQDGAGKRSLLVVAKNLPEVHFRAYRVDLEQWIGRSRDWSLLPASDEMRQLMRERKPAHEWSVALPPTPDFRPHKTFVTPPMREPGLYLVVASVRKDFAEGRNRILGVNFVVSDLVTLVQDDRQGGIEVRVLSGESGRPVAGAEVRLYRLDYQRGHQVAAEKRTDKDGAAQLTWERSRQYESYFVLARSGGHVSVSSSPFNTYRADVPPEVTATLVYTDRSVYRPLQKLFFKVVAYRGSPRDARYRTVPGADVTVTLRDPNHQVVETKRLKTNAYGTAAGELVIPTGRLLGQWRVEASPSGAAFVRVEEYKRPTFEVSFKDEKAPMRLNRPATLVGEARYYFGLPVTSGKVRWRVSRETVYPYWWHWFWGGPREQSQIVATGTAALADDGTFRITFTPEADEKRASSGVTFRYQVTADVTDDGGETRSATRSARLGFVAVEADIRPDAAFLLSGQPASVKIARTDLDGAPREGKGSWRLFALEQPKEAVLPADEPPPEAPERPTVSTPGDRLRARWETSLSPVATMARWKDGIQRASGSLSHDANGEATVALPPLPPGAWRLRYETVDDFGAKFETFRDLVVAGPNLPLELPALLMVERSSVEVGQTARVLAHSGLEGQPMVLDVFRNGRRVERKHLLAGKTPSVIELPIRDADRGGFALTLVTVRDFQEMSQSASVFVPWDDKELKVEFATFRDKLRPGSKETWRITVRGKPGARPEAAAAELLAYMYDQSLDVFAPHAPPQTASLYPNLALAAWTRSNLAQAWAQWISSSALVEIPAYPVLHGDQLNSYESYGIGGPGRRGVVLERRRMMLRNGDGPTGGMPGAAPAREEAAKGDAPMAPPPAQAMVALGTEAKDAASAEVGRQAKVELRRDFSETAFFVPHLIAGADGSATLEFKVPDSVTAWSVWVHAITKDLRGGSAQKTVRSVKELMVRPYIPRFLREGDQATIKVVVNNASDRPLKGELRFDIVDPETDKSVLAEFGSRAAGPQPFSAEPGKNATLSFPISAPNRVGQVAFRVTATAGDFSDGELRPIPLLPSRMHLRQSRFVTLRDQDRRTLSFPDMARGDDPTLIHDRLVVTVDAQLFYTVLQALPYLARYPYECTEQTLNRFVSAGIVSSVYRDHPAVAKMAGKLSKRTTPLESFDGADPNRKMALEETPWLIEARGGQNADEALELANLLDPSVAQAERHAALAKLRKAQTASGGFPWWPGGPPSPYMTLYIAHGFAKAAEFKVDVPKDMVQRAWQYLAKHFRDEYAHKMPVAHCCWEFLTFLNYVASSYPDASWTGDALTLEERRRILDFSFEHWKRHSPYLKGLLALTLKRMGRPDDARLVFDSMMDSAKTTADDGTFWAPEPASWLWYNDTIETHAFALRTLTELHPKDERRGGLVQWLLVNKKLNHWKSTRATAEVVYALVKYLEAEKALGMREDAKVTIGPIQRAFVFEPDEYTGKKNQVVVSGKQLDPKTMSTVVVEKQSKGLQFASATWHFSTDKLPQQGHGDLFQVSRAYFRREKTGREVVKRPLADGAKLEVGDEIEVQLSLKSRHAAEYVHLRDPRGAGLEPENATSRWRWNLGIGWYEEIRDSGANFFFEWLPAGEYTFTYRLRANMAGTFRVGPATVQSMYAPEFAAYSQGHVLTIATGGR